MDIGTVSTIIDTGLNVLATIGGSAVAAAFLPKPSANAYQIFLIVRKLLIL